MPLGRIRVLFSAVEIAARVDALAAEIAHVIPADFVMVGLLKGAWVFVADLARALNRAGARPEIEFLRLASYGLARESSGSVQLLGDIPAGLAGRPVLLVDDIVDTGRSIAYAAAKLRRHGESSRTQVSGVNPAVRAREPRYPQLWDGAPQCIVLERRRLCWRHLGMFQYISFVRQQPCAGFAQREQSAVKQ